MKLEIEESKWRFGSGSMAAGNTYILYLTHFSKPEFYMPNGVFSPNYRLNLAMPPGAELRIT